MTYVTDNRAVAVLAAAVLLVSPRTGNAQPDISGDWIGQIDFGREWQRINFHFSHGSSQIQGLLDLPQQGRTALPLRLVDVQSTHIRVEWEGRSGLATYEGDIVGSEMAGTFQLANMHGHSA